MNGNNDLFITAVKVAGGKIGLEYTDLEQNRPYVTEEKDVPHPDLYNSLKKLGQYLAEVHYVKDNQDKVTITGFSNKSDSDFVVIKGTLTTPSGKKVAINSDAIDIEKELYGFEQDLSADIDDVRNEAQAFFFGGKKSQQVIKFDDEPQEVVMEVVQDSNQEPDQEPEEAHDGKMAAAEPSEPQDNDFPERDQEELLNEEPSEGMGVPGL